MMSFSSNVGAVASMRIRMTRTVLSIVSTTTTTTTTRSKSTKYYSAARISSWNNNDRTTAAATAITTCRFFSAQPELQQESSRRHILSNQEATSAWLAAGGDGRVTLHDEAHSATASFNDNDEIGVGRNQDEEVVGVTMGINAYGTSTHPRPEVIERSSCTSSSPRIEAFTHVDKIRSTLVEGGLELRHLQSQSQSQSQSSPQGMINAVSALVESNRSRLLQVLGLEHENVSVVMCASGTDAELMGAIAGIASAGIESETVTRWTAANRGGGRGAAVATGGAALLSILLPGTGSGVGDAAGMRHHSAAAPQCDTVQPGEPLEGVVDGLVVAFEPAREGVDVTNRKELRDYIDTKKIQTKATHVLLHAIAGSKTGMHQPPLVVTDALAAATTKSGGEGGGGNNSSSDILVCIDACQMRVTPEYIQSQLSKGYIVLLTGSKFYGGPPFAGACLLPASRAREIEEMAAMEGGIPSGLSAYFTKDDIPAQTMPNLRSALPAVPNTGLALRWTAALHSMERFQSSPAFMTKRVAKRWVSRVRALSEGFYPAVEVLDAPGIDDELEHRIGNVNTVISLMIRTGGEQGGSLGVKGLKQLQLLLGTDLSDLCDGTTFPKSAKGVAKIKAQIGQPVVLGGGAQHGVVRLAIGATDICEAVEMAMQLVTTREDDKDDPFATLDALSDAIDAMVIHDTKLLRKIELLATHWDAVAKRFDELPATAVRWQARLAAEGVVGPAASEKQKPQEVTNVDIGWLKPHEMVVNQDRVNALVDAIGRWGAYRKPLLVDKDSGSILDGHHRYFAALELGLEKVPAALVDYLEDDSISVELWPGDHGVATISKQDVIDMCLSPNVFPPKTSRHTFAEPLSPIFVPLEELNDNDD